MNKILLLLAFCSFSAFADLKIENAWVKNAPPVVPVRAAYLTLVNDSEDKIVITKVTSPQFKTVEPHATILKNGVYSMHALHNLTIAPKSSLLLEPAGKHLMLMMPKQSLSGLTSIQLEFHTAKNTIITINAPIKN